MTSSPPPAANAPHHAAAKRPALGRGLGALIPQRPAGAPGMSSLGSQVGLLMLPVEAVEQSASQPRKHFPEEQLNELAASIKEHGVLQPIVVRRKEANKYELVAGERRWRACQRAGLAEVPAVVKDMASDDVMTVALVENLQRQDLNAIEEAEAYKHLVEDLGHTQEEVARSVGKDRATVANAMRLLKLPTSIRDSVVDGQLTMGHARALLSLAEGSTTGEAALLRAAQEVIARDLSVRATEAMVRDRKQTSTPEPAKDEASSRAASAVRELEDQLRRRFGVRSVVRAKNGKGSLELHFHTLDELDELLVKLGVK